VRDCIFLLADLGMVAAFKGFFFRQGFYHALGTAPFHVDPQLDIICDRAGNDPGVYTRAHELLRTYQSSHRYAVIVLDNAWEGSPGVEKIRANISANMELVGWQTNRFVVIVIDPEIEAWMWQDNPHVARAFGFSLRPSLRDWLCKQALWPADSPKPPDPKLAFEKTLKVSKAKIPSVVFKKICSGISFKYCVDDAFGLLKNTLQKWFPDE